MKNGLKIFYYVTSWIMLLIILAQVNGIASLQSSTSAGFRNFRDRIEKQMDQLIETNNYAEGFFKRNY